MPGSPGTGRFPGGAPTATTQGPEPEAGAVRVWAAAGARLALKGSVMLAKLLSRSPHARLGSFSSIQPTANMLCSQRSEDTLG